jgi:hypothetical protein
VRVSLLDSLADFERWGGDCAYVFPRGYRHERWSYQRVTGLTYQFARELQARQIVKAMRCFYGVRTARNGSRRFWDARFAE